MASRLSISLEGPATASPFPSPSSSFLTPPTPGAHEFAVKPPPSLRCGRKGSATLNHPSTNTSPALSPRSSTGSAVLSNRSTLIAFQTSSVDAPDVQPAASPSPTPRSCDSPTLPVSPVTPTPGVLLSEINIPPPSPIGAPTNHIPLPTLDSSHPDLSPEPLAPIQAPLLLNDPAFSTRNSLEVPPSSPIAARPRTNLINHGSRPLSTASTTSTTSRNSVCSSASAFDPNLFSSRPAPPSPGGGSTPSLSRKPSTRSKPGSKPVSRANSLRHHRGSSHASLANNTSSPVSTLGTRGEGAAATLHNHRVSSGSQIHTRTFSSSSLASLSKANFDMGISASSPAIQDITATSITTISSEESSVSPSTTSTSISTADTQLLAPSSQPDEHKVFIKIRDFAFQPADERHNGQGPLVPKPNRVGRMNRRLGGRSHSASSISSSDGDGIDEDDEPDGWGWNAGGYGTRGFGYGGGWVGGRFSWAVSSGTGAATAATIFDQEKAYAAAAANLSAAASKANGISSNEDGYPSRSEMDRNFLDSESEEYYDAEDNEGLYNEEEEDKAFEDASSGVEDDDEPLYPGLYRALYAFEPEGTAEMRLVEDQIVRVVGRGGGVGWAVVVAEPQEGTGTDVLDSIIDGASKITKHALVPESYLEPYKLDWELDEGDAATNNRRTA